MPRSKSVLVTGASSGIGHACAALLASRGHRVFAGVRREADAERLRKELRGKVTPVILDVTDPHSIALSLDTISAAARGALDGLVNNAGISVGGPLEILPLEAFRRQIDVNVIGQLAAAKTFLPLLRAARGRILFMSSILGKFPLPGLGAYSCAKYAIEAMAEALSMELRDTGVSVSIIAPGSISTPIWEKALALGREMAGDVPESQWDLYKDQVAGLRSYAERTSRRGISPERVARTVEKALTARVPRKRYAVGLDSRFFGWLAPRLPAALRQAILRAVVLRR